MKNETRISFANARRRSMLRAASGRRRAAAGGGGRPRDLHATIRLISPGQFNYSERSLIISESFFRVINFFERHGPGAIRREGPAAISRDNADLYGREAAAIRRARARTRARAAPASSGAPARTPLICAGYLRRFMLIDEAESAKPA